MARIKAVLRRAVVEVSSSDNSDIPKECVNYPGLMINLTDYSVYYNKERVEMPPKELELFYFLASHPNQVFTREQLLDNIWSYDYIGDTRTVDVHIKRLREKFPQAEKWQLATVWGVGYKFEYHD
jgi:DNA-binding response OmpR family regulator